MDDPNSAENIVKKLISSIHSIEGRLVLIEQKFTEKIRNIDVKVSELEDLTKEFLGEDGDGLSGENEDSGLVSGTATPKPGGDAGDNGDDFFKAAERRKDNEKHAQFCPYMKEIGDDIYEPNRPDSSTDLRGFQFLRQYIYFIMHDEQFNMLAYTVFITVMLLIFISTVAYVLETVPPLKGEKIWEVLEVIVSIAFTVEYALRIIVVRNRLEYFIQPMNFVDFLAVIPFYMEKFFKYEGAVLRMIRVIRLARISRLRTSANVSEYIEVMKTTLEKTVKESFGMLTALLFLEVIVFSSLIYVCENGKHDPAIHGAYNEFNSIPAAAWWCVVTITTVGYGDMYPVTTIGKIIGMVTTFTGLIVMAIFVIIIGGNFEKIYKDYQRKKRKHKNAFKLQSRET